ncbi:hypothetical protein EDD22DRAFT_847288 [Suillus occidentalis]|nr:hypothetical protein EDD22DRAFT_847288 [Suillus occidentalis]
MIAYLRRDIYNLAVKQTAIQLATEESPEHNVLKKEHLTVVHGIKSNLLLGRLIQSIPHFSKKVVLPGLVNLKKVESSAPSERSRKRKSATGFRRSPKLRGRNREHLAVETDDASSTTQAHAHLHSLAVGTTRIALAHGYQPFICRSPYRHIPFFSQTPAGFFLPCAEALPHIFQPSPANTACVSRPTTKTAAAAPGVLKKNVPMKASTSQIMHPRLKLRRENAVAALMTSKLSPMEADGMTDDDHIFLTQLEELRLDQLRRHTLGDAREIVARADTLGPKGELEHATRDRQGAMQLEENARRMKEEEFCRLEEL